MSVVLNKDEGHEIVLVEPHMAKSTSKKAETIGKGAVSEDFVPPKSFEPDDLKLEKTQIRLTPEQIKKLKIRAATEGKQLYQLYNELLSEELVARQQEIREGKVNADLRYASAPRTTKKHNAQFDEGIFEAAKKIAQQDGTSPTKIIYTALAKATHDEES